MQNPQPPLDGKSEFDIETGVVFLNHASFGPVTRRGRTEVASLMDRWGHLQGGPDVDEETFRLLDESRRMFGEMIGADLKQVAFAPNTSYGLNAVLWGIDLRKGEKILTTEVEFPAVVYAVQHIARCKGLKIEVLPCPKGYLEMDTLERALSDQTAVLAISWVQYFNGYRYDLEQLTDLCHRHNCLVLLDAIQGVGAIAMDAQASGVDALACGAQKWLLGQTGSGFLYVSPNPVRAVEPPYQGWLSVDWDYRFEELQDADRSLYPDGRRWEIGTYPFFAVRLSHAGLCVLTEAGQPRIWNSIQTVLDRIEAGLGESRYQFTRFPDEKNRSGIGLIGGPRCQSLHQHLKERQIHTSFREGNIRVSPHFHNTADEADSLTAAVREFENQS